MRKRVVVIVLSLLVSITGIRAQASLEEGDAKYKARQIKEAIELYEKAANEGSAEAKYKLAMIYHEGDGVEKNHTTAVMWLKRAVRQRYAKAEYQLALCYVDGHGVPVSYDKAIMYMKASAYRGYDVAQKRLADLYSKGIIVEADQKESDRWMAMYRGEPISIASTELHPTKIKAPVDSTKVSVKEPEKKNAEKVMEKSTDSIPQMVVEVDSDGVTRQRILFWLYNSQDAASLKETDNKQIKEQENLKLAHVPLEAIRKSINDEDTARLTEKSSQNNAETPKEPEPQKEPEGNGAPVVKILYPEDQSYFHTDIVKLKYQLLAQGLEGATQIVVMVDGVRQSDTRAVKQANTIDVEVPNRDCTIMMYAQNERGNSVPATIRLIRENVTQFDLPHLYAVVIGVGDYDDPVLPDLKLATKDAQDFARAIESKKGYPYSDVQIKLLCDQEATRSDIFEAMQWMAQQARPNDLCMFFFAGHGYRDEKDRFYFVPFGGKTGRTYECFSSFDFRTAADEINSKLIIFADACYSAALLGDNRSASAQHFVEQLRRSKNGMMLYASSSGDTKSKENTSWGNGAFTKALLEAFHGAARHDGDEGLSTRALEIYLYEAVRRTTGYKQTPYLVNPNVIEHFNIFTYEK